MVRQAGVELEQRHRRWAPGEAGTGVGPGVTDSPVGLGLGYLSPVLVPFMKPQRLSWKERQW